MSFNISFTGDGKEATRAELKDRCKAGHVPESVEKVLDDLISALPKAGLLTSTGISVAAHGHFRPDGGAPQTSNCSILVHQVPI